jgi:NAD(P)-dependent dehydrogenase (short-subunit alcohol dehydrogenase family)
MAGKKKLQGQVAIVSGASRGLGLALAGLLTRAGAAVVMAARSEEQLQREAQRLTKAGGRALAVPTDVTDVTQVETLVETALEKYGRIDILVNNAALVWPLDEVGEADPDEWAYNIHANLVGPFYLAHHVLPTMIEQHYGRIVNVSSGLGSAVYAGFSAYGAAKAGLDQFTRILALELKEAGITVNGIYPGMVDTDMQADIRSVDTSESSLDLSMFQQAAEAGKLISADEAAKRIYWLVGPWSRQRSGEFFSFRDEAWLAQVERDING